MNKLLPFLALAFCASIFAQNNKITLDDGIEITSIKDTHPSLNDAPSVNMFLVKSAGKTYLIDAGFGNAFKNKHIDPNTINSVFITHKHSDHTSGLMQNNAPVFKVPVYVSKLGNEKIPSEGFKDYKTFNFGDTVAPGIVAMDADGHAPGHTAFLVGTGKKKLLIGVDYLPESSSQFPHTTGPVKFDMNKPTTLDANISITKQAGNNGWLITGSHEPNHNWGQNEKPRDRPH